MREGFKIFYSIYFAFQLGFLIALPLLGFLLLGYFLDKKFSSSPFFLLSSIIIGLTVIAFWVYYQIAPLMKK